MRRRGDDLSLRIEGEPACRSAARPVRVVIFGASGDRDQAQAACRRCTTWSRRHLPKNSRSFGWRGVRWRRRCRRHEGRHRAGGGVEADDPKLDEFVGRIATTEVNFDAIGLRRAEGAADQGDAKYGTQGNRSSTWQRRSGVLLGHRHSISAEHE